jgi:hypothetical protein
MTYVWTRRKDSKRAKWICRGRFVARLSYETQGRAHVLYETDRGRWWDGDLHDIREETSDVSISA